MLLRFSFILFRSSIADGNGSFTKKPYTYFTVKQGTQHVPTLVEKESNRTTQKYNHGNRGNGNRGSPIIVNTRRSRQYMRNRRCRGRWDAKAEQGLPIKDLGNGPQIGPSQKPPQGFLLTKHGNICDPSDGAHDAQMSLVLWASGELVEELACVHYCCPTSLKELLLLVQSAVFYRVGPSFFMLQYLCFSARSPVHGGSFVPPQPGARCLLCC